MLASCAAANTKPKHRTPNAMARNLDMLVARASFIPGQQKGRTKSSRQMAAKEFSPLDTVLLTSSYEVLDTIRVNLMRLNDIT